jgi:glycosyl transferase family 25
MASDVAKRARSDGRRGHPDDRAHAVVINLDRDKARLERIAAEFARCGMAFERFAAVEGLAVPTGLRQYFFCADGRPAPSLTKGEIGCYASHLALWRRVVSGQYPAVTLVCEDDIRLPEDFRDLLDATLTRAPEGWDIIRLSAPTRRLTWPIRTISDDHRLVRYSKVPSLLGAYLVSQAGAKKLLKAGLRTRPVDLDMARTWETDLSLYGVEPAPVHQPTRNSSSIDAVEQRRYARRARGLLGIRSRLFGRERFQRTWHNARTVGLYPAIKAEVLNLFRGRPIGPKAARSREPLSGRNEVLKV